jgi:flagellar secretion chaperone FliS
MLMRHGQFGAARARYQSVDMTSRIEGASPHGLVAILFDELLKALDAMAAAIRRGDLAQRGTRQARALSILHGLDGSLDFEKGGDIAEGLSAIYREARRLTIAGGRANDAEQVMQAREMVGEIASAWEQIAKG